MSKKPKSKTPALPPSMTKHAELKLIRKIAKSIWPKTFFTKDVISQHMRNVCLLWKSLSLTPLYQLSPFWAECLFLIGAWFPAQEAGKLFQRTLNALEPGTSKNFACLPSNHPTRRRSPSTYFIQVQHTRVSSRGPVRLLKEDGKIGRQTLLRAARFLDLRGAEGEMIFLIVLRSLMVAQMATCLPKELQNCDFLYYWIQNRWLKGK